MIRSKGWYIEVYSPPPPGRWGAGALAAWAFLATLEFALELPLQVAPQTLILAITAAAGSGIISAWYPATRAVALDVVAAIRAE